MQRHVSTLPIPNSYIIKLTKSGIEYLNDLKNLKPTDLIKEVGFTKNEITDLYETLDMFKMAKPVSAFDLLEQEKLNDKAQNITTLSSGFDQILGGGFPTGKIIEMCGAAGVGKTQVSMQQCVNVQIPVGCGGLGGQAVYIDTEGSFMSNRMVEIAGATVKLLGNKYSEKELGKFTVENIMSNIFLYRCIDHVQLTSIIHNLKTLMDKHPRIKLIVIDSLAYPFRFVDHANSNSTAMKSNVLNSFMTSAYDMITKFRMTFLVTNQMTTRFVRDADGNSSSSVLVPALGETWAHSANMRLILAWKNSRRTASVTKSSYMPDAVIYYKISEIGFVDLCEDLGDQNEINVAPAKKRRFND